MRTPQSRAREIIEAMAGRGDFDDALAEKVIVRFKNAPSDDSTRLVFDTVQCLEESKFRRIQNHTIRLDKRPANQGGPQMHIEGPSGQRWAFRHTGARSEPHKYTLRTTNRVREIVSDFFGIPPSQVESCEFVSAHNGELLIEVSFR
jgi:hypothetical protein